MNVFSTILSNLQGVIAAAAARDRRLTVLLVAVWGRLARMRTRLERLIALWRAGTLPKQRAARVGRVYEARVRARFPTSPGWLVVRVRDAVPFGSQLAHMLTDAEWQAFLAAVPQARRVLRPLMRMLMVDPVPEVVRLGPKPVVDYVTRVVLPGVVAEGPAFSTRG